MVAARVEIAGLDPWRLGGQLWATGSRMDGLCFAGATEDMAEACRRIGEFNGK